MNYEIWHQDALQYLAQFARPNTFDGCLCDPPYGFTAFTKMPTQAWERKGPPCKEIWEELHRVLRPGAWLMAATGCKLYDVIAHDIRETGFEMYPPFIWMFQQASATGVNEGYRLKPGFDLFVMARKPGKGRLRGRLRAQDPAVRPNGHVPTTISFDKDIERMLGQIEGLKTTLFFSGKCTREERNRVPTDHPTLKPLVLTEYLARLIHQPRAERMIVPFAGVGSEMIGALRAGWKHVVGVEREKRYVKCAHKRVPAFVKGAVLC